MKVERTQGFGNETYTYRQSHNFDEVECVESFGIQYLLFNAPLLIKESAADVIFQLHSSQNLISENFFNNSELSLHPSSYRCRSGLRFRYFL